MSKRKEKGYKNIMDGMRNDGTTIPLVKLFKSVCAPRNLVSWNPEMLNKYGLRNDSLDKPEE